LWTARLRRTLPLVPNLVAAFEHAAAVHERSAEFHERAAAFFTEQGNQEAAYRALECARRNRGGAIEDRERARLRRELLRAETETPPPER
jgi:hypothetical protein